MAHELLNKSNFNFNKIPIACFLIKPEIGTCKSLFSVTEQGPSKQRGPWEHVGSTDHVLPQHVCAVNLSILLAFLSGDCRSSMGITLATTMTAEAETDGRHMTLSATLHCQARLPPPSPLSHR